MRTSSVADTVFASTKEYCKKKTKGDLCTFVCLMEAKLVIRKGHRSPIIHYYCFNETKENEKKGEGGGASPKTLPNQVPACAYTSYTHT